MIIFRAHQSASLAHLVSSKSLSLVYILYIDCIHNIQKVYILYLIYREKESLCIYCRGIYIVCMYIIYILSFYICYMYILGWTLPDDSECYPRQLRLTFGLHVCLLMYLPRRQTFTDMNTHIVKHAHKLLPVSMRISI